MKGILREGSGVGWAPSKGGKDCSLLTLFFSVMKGTDIDLCGNLSNAGNQGRGSCPHISDSFLAFLEAVHFPVSFWCQETLSTGFRDD